MAATFKLDMEELEDVCYQLIAIHTNLEDYHLAYFLNKSLAVTLKKSKTDLQVNFKNQETCYSRFHFEDQKELIEWDLIENKNTKDSKNHINSNNLFSELENGITTTNYFLPEFKKVNYLLKITNEKREKKILEYVANINSIEKINLVYCVASETIKNKNNLIF